jgi:hypothetical protein
VRAHPGESTFGRLAGTGHEDRRRQSENRLSGLSPLGVTDEGHKGCRWFPSGMVGASLFSEWAPPNPTGGHTIDNRKVK